jgi:hypothetical protein
MYHQGDKQQTRYSPLLSEIVSSSTDIKAVPLHAMEALEGEEV